MKRSRASALLPALVAALALVAAACGDTDSSSAPGATSSSSTSVVSTTRATTTTAAPATTTTTTTTAPPTTTTAPTTTLPPTTTTAPPEPPRVLLVGDSTLLAVESYGTEEALQGFEPVLEVASCRTLGVPSCGRAPVPPNSVETITAAEGPFDGVVIMAGYDEWWTSFASSFETVMQVSRDQGAEWVLWLVYPEDVPYRVPDGRLANESFIVLNELLREFEASGDHPDLLLAEWPTYFARTDGWITRDGIHLHPEGAYGVADYISRWIAHITGLPCPQPVAPGIDVRTTTCPNPDTLSIAVDVGAIYPAVP